MTTLVPFGGPSALPLQQLVAIDIPAARAAAILKHRSD